MQKGLWFKCSEPYHPSRVCPDKQIKIMILEEGNTQNEAEVDRSTLEGD